MPRLRRYLIAGLLVWLPLGVTVLVIKLLVDFMDQTLLVLPAAYHPDKLFGFHIPGLDCLPDSRAADGVPVVDHQFNLVDGKTTVFATLPQKGNVALALVTQRKVGTYPQRTESQVVKQQFHKIRRAHLAGFLAERVRDHIIHAEIKKQRRFLLRRRQIITSLQTAQHHIRMGEKRHNNGQPVRGARLFHQPPDELLVADMHAIKYTNRYNRRLLERRLRERKSSFHSQSRYM